MSVLINGTTGLSGTNGSASTPAVQGEDTNTGIFFPAADTVAVATGGAERLRVDSSGNAGLGVTPSAWSASAKAFQFGNYGSLYQNASGYPELAFNTFQNASNVYTYSNTDVATRYSQTNGQHQFFTAPSGTAGNAITFTQAMTLNASGNLGIGTSSPSGRLTVRNDSTTAQPFIDIVNRANSSTFDMGGIRFSAYRDVADPSYVAAIWANVDAPLGNLGNLYFGTKLNGDGALPTSRVIILSNGDFIVLGSYAQKASGTTWVNPSDVRLKENVRDYECGLDELMQVRVRRWEYNGKGGTVEGSAGLGVVADEIMSVLPDTVSVGGDIGDSDVPDLKKFDATEITWLLVKSVQEQQALIKEQQALITALTARVAQLEAQ